MTSIARVTAPKNIKNIILVTNLNNDTYLAETQDRHYSYTNVFRIEYKNVYIII